MRATKLFFVGNNLSGQFFTYERIALLGGMQQIWLLKRRRHLTTFIIDLRR